MRIRSIKPEFYRSDDIDALDWESRFLFIALWSYVDDNGVGLDKLASIAADLFAGDLERDPQETFARVSRGLQTLSEAGRITRYTVDGKAYLHITNWEKHQRIDKPNKARYPSRPATTLRLARLSRNPRDSLARPQRLEQGNRGTGEQRKPCAGFAGRGRTVRTRYRDRTARPEQAAGARAGHHRRRLRPLRQGVQLHRGQADRQVGH
ncbi:hypothetical protein LZP97_27105 (plasmid) [Rhodococcus sp. DMF-1]|uniref:hypothetical protein n=1 Tax=Rhodococcus sp. DMF-1 TaxID=2907624 RepID=UPI001F467416|nr:hypothetical protein [Rhodococcus sp. DMF-1]UIR39756.1 hypothetical protein LZP97_27105 [Rhodococcus sp. DMF-1]